MTIRTDVCAGAIYGEHQRRMLDWYGLRPSRARICLRVVLGKQCVAYNQRKWGGLNWDCPCITMQGIRGASGLFDHTRIWLDRDGRHVLTSEPYDATFERIDELAREVVGMGIAVTATDRSPWYPGSTTLLMFTKDD